MTTGMTFMTLLATCQCIQQIMYSNIATMQFQNNPTDLSFQNHVVERIWPEVNQRVNYPIKRKFIEIEENNEIDILVYVRSSVSRLYVHTLLQKDCTHLCRHGTLTQ